MLSLQKSAGEEIVTITIKQKTPLSNYVMWIEIIRTASQRIKIFRATISAFEE